MLSTSLGLGAHAQGICKGITYLPRWESGKTPQEVIFEWCFEGQGGVSQGDDGWGDSVTGGENGAALDVCEDAAGARG